MSKLLQHFPPSPYKQITENPGNTHHILVFLLPTVFCHWHPWCPRMTIQTVKDRTELRGRVQRIQNERCGACVLCPKEDEPKCERCDSSCTECKGPGPLNCTVCPATMQLYLEESRCLPCCSDSDLAGTPECCDCSETQGETMLKSGNGAEGLCDCLGWHLKIKRGTEQKCAAELQAHSVFLLLHHQNREGFERIRAVTTDEGEGTFFHSQLLC